jgi:hypothetical protein
MNNMHPARDGDDLYGDTVVAALEIKLRRNGAMSVAGSITDEAYGLYLLDTARDTLRNYHARRRLGQVGGLIVPAHDTALVGTAEEKRLLAAREELVRAGEEGRGAQCLTRHARPEGRASTS